MDMMLLYTDFRTVFDSVKDIGLLKNKTVFITGANGLIGSFIIDFIMFLNDEKDYNTTVVANCRNFDKLKKRFGHYLSSNWFECYIGNINEPIIFEKEVDYIINCASNTHPFQYSTQPISTITTNIIGTSNVLDFAVKSGAVKTIFLSSVEIYGENVSGIDRFKEEDMGYINCNTLRAGYNEAKRCGEALCQAYIEQKGLDISIVRLPRVYGPTVKKDDTKVMSQFINKALSHENIVLKSEGNQFFSYLYVADAVSGILRCLVAGSKGEAYNLGNIESDIRLKDLAQTIASLAGTKVIFDLPNEVEKKGFSKATIARLDYTKAEIELDWHPKFSINDGLKRTIELLS